MLGPHRHEALAVVFQYPIRICIVDTVSRLGQPSGTMSSSRFGRGIPKRQRRPLPLRRGAEDPLPRSQMICEFLPRLGSAWHVRPEGKKVRSQAWTSLKT